MSNKSLKLNKMPDTYIEIINFCSKLTIPQLMYYRNLFKRFKTKEYLVACEVLKIRLEKNQLK